MQKIIQKLMALSVYKIYSTVHYVVSIVLPKQFGYAIAIIGKERFPPSLEGLNQSEGHSKI